MNFENIKSVIERVFDNNEDVNPGTTGEVRDSIEAALNYLDKGELRVADPLGDSQRQVNQWLKKAVLLSFKLNDMDVISGGPESPNKGPANWWDKIPSKFSGWDKPQNVQVAVCEVSQWDMITCAANAVESLIFCIFTFAMGCDQYEAIGENTPYIDRLQKKKGKLLYTKRTLQGL